MYSVLGEVFFSPNIKSMNIVQITLNVYCSEENYELLIMIKC